MEIEIKSTKYRFEIDPGCPAVTGGSPDNWAPEECATIEKVEVWLKSKKRWVELDDETLESREEEFWQAIDRNTIDALSDDYTVFDECYGL